MAFWSEVHGNVVWKKNDHVWKKEREKKKVFSTALWKFPKKYRSVLPPVAFYQRMN